jgi:hypothetical protein
MTWLFKILDTVTGKHKLKNGLAHSELTDDEAERHIPTTGTTGSVLIFDGAEGDFQDTMTCNPAESSNAGIVQILEAGGRQVSGVKSLVEIEDEATSAQDYLIHLVRNDATGFAKLEGVPDGAAVTYLGLNSSNEVIKSTIDQLKAVTVEITPAEMVLLYSSPKTIIAAPGAGKTIDIINAFIYYDYQTTLYTGTTDLWMGAPSNNAVFPKFWESAIDYIGECQNGVMGINEAVTFWSGDAELSGGDSPIRVHVLYRIITL